MQVRESSSLRVVLAAALRVGNAINMGTHLGGAVAVRMESLLKMADLRVGHLPQLCPGSITSI